MQPSVKKTNDAAINATRNLRVEILNEAIWTLNNLISEDKQGIDEILFVQLGIQEVLMTHMLENFSEEAYGIEKNHLKSREQGTFIKPNLPPLEPFELDLFKEIIWMVNNLSNQGAIAYSMVVNCFP